MNTDNSKTKLTNHIHNQIKKCEVWNKNLEKFYKDRHGDKFVKSNCKGKKKALYIGINYIGSKSELNGCINDVKNISQLFSKKYGFKQAVILTDDNQDPKKKPTYDNIVNAMKWLVKDAKSGDSLVFHYSGHGGTVKDLDGDEIDGLDETILPCDYTENGQIIDDEIYKLLVEPLPKGCKLTAIFDSCHSGTIMDLPYTYQCQNNIEVIENDVRKEIFRKSSDVVNSIMGGNPVNIYKSIHDIYNGSLKKAARNGTNPNTLQRRQCVGDIVQFSGCKDNQTSADMTVGNVSTGAMSYAIITLLKEDKEYTYTELLACIKKILSEKNFTQIPQLSTSRPLNMNDKFII
ncbi:Metacaspase Yca1 [Piromyces finnis]|uniref:Metacaspase Yca1 n=1 Tax=Piromyces finnis TaxID=1754191 RepID=A0A1Y1VP75_9FUNG|nr:Metacaspase Yca1 [Piromyces finnis]|eukprot:ORX61218.1 Metacaspase Yca1 [Piromyces finnis]